jgi:hypothetical protein
MAGFVGPLKDFSHRERVSVVISVEGVGTGPVK